MLWAAKTARNGKKRQHGWQKVARNGNVGGKNGTVWAGCDRMHVARFALAWRCGWLFASLYGVVKVLAARGGAAVMEPNYHKSDEMSSERTYSSTPQPSQRRGSEARDRDGGEGIAAVNGRRTAGGHKCPRVAGRGGDLRAFPTPIFRRCEPLMRRRRLLIAGGDARHANGSTVENARNREVRNALAV